MEDVVIPLSGEQTTTKKALVSLFKKYIFDPFVKGEETEVLESKKKVYVDTIVRNQDCKVLLLRRSNNSAVEPGKLCFPGGHLEVGETIEAGAKRELEEETSLKADVRFLQTVEKADATIHYFEALLIFNDGQVIDSSIMLDNNEHMNYEWVNPDDVDNLPDLCFDLGSYVGELLDKCYPITIVKQVYSNPEEEIADAPGGTGSLDEWLKIIIEGFDKGIVTEEEYMQAKQQYTRIKKAEALQVIKKGFDEGIATEEEYLEAKKYEVGQPVVS